MVLERQNCYDIRSVLSSSARAGVSAVFGEVEVGLCCTLITAALYAMLCYIGQYIHHWSKMIISCMPNCRAIY